MTVVVYGGGVASESSPVDLDFQGPYEKPTGTNLGVRLEKDFRLDGETSVVMKLTSFFFISVITSISLQATGLCFQTAKPKLCNTVTN